MKSLGEILKNNSYPGRGIVIGKAGDNFCIAYMLMGRSENSRNRIFIEENEELFTKPFDESKVADPSLIIYTPLRSIANHTIITNGDQTDTIYECLAKGIDFEKALETREFEPDAPNFTPRISGLVSTFEEDFSYKLSILKKTDSNASGCNRFTYSYSPLPNVGHFIHTYMNDPLLSFEGEPETIYIPDDINEFANNIWENLNSDNKISLYVKYTNFKNNENKTVLINKNK
ncbi:MAG: IMP cyclohydrolase [Eubacteriales bacterium]